MSTKISPDVAICLNHWKENRPKMYMEMKKAGTLVQAAMDAVEQTNKEVEQLVNRGIPYYQADEFSLTCKSARQTKATSRRRNLF